MTHFLRWLIRLLYGFRAYNEAVLASPGPILLLPNHVSWWDWLLIGVCLEADWRFVTSSATANVSWLHRRIMVNRRTFPVDMNSPYAVKHIAEYLQKGGRLVLFPEGQISRTGSLMKLFDGTGFLIHKTSPKVVTAHLRGAQHLPFSRNPNRKQWFPRLSVHFSNILAPPRLDHISVSTARARLTDWLLDQMVSQKFEIEMTSGPLTMPAAILQSARQQPGRVILQDATMQALTYRRLVLGAELLAAQWRERISDNDQRVGVLLPNVNAMPVVTLSLWLANKVPAILNYTTGPATLLSCVRLAGLKQIITSKAFVSRARLDLELLRVNGVELVFLEDVRARIGPISKLRAWVRRSLGFQLTAFMIHPSATAVILFTSGSESEPKGVELTHRNLLANIRQMLSVVDLADTDRIFNALPLFHSFGLTVGLMLPLVQGVFIFLYVSPLHYRVVPSAFYNLNCTVFFGTNTFLAGYARKAHPYDFRALRYLFAGAEKIQESTSSLWMRRFGARVLEGYGATECSPCISVNLPMRPRHGSAGRFLPGIEYRLEPVEGVADAGGNPGAETPLNPENVRPTAGQDRSLPASSPAGTVGRLLVRGPNVMRGYLNPDANARFQALDGWYDTGDVARVDNNGFVHILGRLKRFAKVSGEMVSLAAVEDALAGAFPDFGLRFALAVLARPDAAKGEKLVVVTNEPRLTLAQIRETIQARGLGNLCVPRELRLVPQIPRLGTGKVNLRELEQMLPAV